jgi:hypothetical protein
MGMKASECWLYGLLFGCDLEGNEMRRLENE